MKLGKLTPYEICFSDLDVEEICMIANIGRSMTNIQDGLEQALEYCEGGEGGFSAGGSFGGVEG